MTTHAVPYASLELNWLPLSIRKSLDQPRIVFTDSKDCSGRYWSRTFGEKPVLTTFDFDRRESAIIEIAVAPSPGSIAHEYRHHWQLHHGVHQPFRSIWNPRDSGWDAHWEEITRYFTVYPEERDALIFETRFAPDDLNLSRADHLKLDI